MEIDQLKSSTASEDQMEMMMMMDKLPDFFCAYSDVGHDLPHPHEFPGATTTSTTTAADNIVRANAISHFIDSPHAASSPSFLSLPSSVPFTNNSTAVQDESTPSIATNQVASARWRGGVVGEFAAGAYDYSQKRNSMAAMREMIFRIAAMQPIHIDPESVKPPKRRNVKISKDPQSVAARHRRERISERIRILQRLVPGGTKMDTASMLDEAIHYVKFLKTQVQSLERAQANRPSSSPSSSSSSTASARIGFPVTMCSGSYFPM